MEIIIINSRFNLFWFELVTVANNIIVKNHGQFRSIEEAEKFKLTLNN